MGQEHGDRYALASRILERLEPELAAEGFELVDVRIFQGGGRQQVRLYVDLPGAQRIDLDGCAAASRSASMLLEAADFFAGPWVLEVSSPGIRRPLRREAHFVAVVGCDVEIKWRQPQAPAQRPSQLRGRLVAVAGGSLTIAPAARGDEAADGEKREPEPVVVPLAAVLEANLDRDFDVQAVISQDRRRRKQEKRAQRPERDGRDGN